MAVKLKPFIDVDEDLSLQIEIAKKNLVYPRTNKVLSHNLCIAAADINLAVTYTLSFRA